MNSFLVAALLCAAYSAVANGQDARTLHQAVEDGEVDVEITGIGGSTGDAILLTVRRRVPRVLRLTLTPGTRFKSVSGTVQDMAGASVQGELLTSNSYRPAGEIVLADDEKHRYVVEAYCLDFHKPNPGPSDRFRIDAPDEQAQRLLYAGKARSASIRAIQAALWMARGGPTERRLKQRFSATDADLAAARELLRHADATSSGPTDASALPRGPLASMAPLRPEASQPSLDSRIPRAPSSAAAAQEKSAEGKFRTWNDATGQFTTEAVFVELKNETLALRRKDGRVVFVPVKRLSAEDRRFAEDEFARIMGEFIVGTGGIAETFVTDKVYGSEVHRCHILLKSPLALPDVEKQFGGPTETIEGILLGSIGKGFPQACTVRHYAGVRLYVEGGEIKEISLRTEIARGTSFNALRTAAEEE